MFSVSSALQENHVLKTPPRARTQTGRHGTFDGSADADSSPDNNATPFLRDEDHADEAPGTFLRNVMLQNSCRSASAL